MIAHLISLQDIKGGSRVFIHLRHDTIRASLMKEMFWGNLSNFVFQEFARIIKQKIICKIVNKKKFKDKNMEKR